MNDEAYNRLLEGRVLSEHEYDVDHTPADDFDAQKKTKEVYEVEDRDLQQAGAEGAKAIARDLEEQIGDIRMLGRLKAGLITLEDICRLYGVSERTVHGWPLEPADTPTQQNLYRVEEMGDQLTD